MTRIIFRDLPAVSTVERQLHLHARDCLFDDDVDMAGPLASPSKQSPWKGQLPLNGSSPWL